MKLSNLAVTQDNLLAAVQVNQDNTVTLRFIQVDDNGALFVRPHIGPGTLPHTIAKTAVDDTNVTSHIPAGKLISHISVLCTLNETAAEGITTTALLAALQSLKGIVCVDADSDAFAIAATGSGGAIPTSESDGQQFYEIPLGVWIPIPLAPGTYLSKGNNETGRLDYRSSSPTIPLDFQFVCS